MKETGRLGVFRGAPVLTKLQEFIIDNPNDWETKLAAAPYSLKITHNGNYVIFKYSQIESDFNESICREARGIILRLPDLRIVRKAFNKFFNVEEKYADKLDWESAIATLKLDGSLVSLWYDDGWHWSTNGTIFAADAPLENGGFKTFQDLIDKALEGYKLDYDKLNPNYCYTMELCSRYNKVVIDYPEIQLWHTVTVDLETLNEVEVDIGIPKPPTYICETKQDYEALVRAFEGNKEGIVVKDSNNKRVKIKTPLYFELHKKANNGKLTTEAALQIILDNEQSEFLSYFPELEVFFQKVESEYEERLAYLISILTDVDKWHKDNLFATRKDFAMWVKTKDKDYNYYFLAYDNKLEKKIDEITGDAKKIVKFLKLEDV